jgi:hypothetical protein
MYRTTRFWGWVFQRWFPDRGWYRLQNWMFSDAPNQWFGPYGTYEAAVKNRGDLMFQQMIEYRLRKPWGCHDVPKQNP